MATHQGLDENVVPPSELWLIAQKEAFQAAMNGSLLAASLDPLVRTAIGQMGNGTRCAFYMADSTGTELHHVTGMSDSYAQCVDGFRIGPESLACGLAVHYGRPLITPDVREEPRWQPWLWLAERYDYRGCWSLPVETSAGKIVGTFAMYFREPRDATADDLEFAGLLTHTASIIISRHQEAEERAKVQQQLRKIERLAAAGRLAASLAHEINNPLSSVMNAVYLLQTSPELSDEARSIATTAASELARVSRIVKQSLSYYRSGAMPKEVNLGDIVNESLHIFEEKIQRAGVQLSKKIEPQPPVSGYADEIRQVIDNLS